MRHWIKKVYTRAEIRKLYLLYVNQEYVEIKRQVDATEVFYCRSYCLFNMFPAPLCPSSGTQRVLYGCCCLWFAGCCFTAVKQHPANRTHNPQLHTRPDQKLENHSTKYHRQQPLNNTLQLLMMGIVVPETCWVNNKICKKNLCCI